MKKVVKTEESNVKNKRKLALKALKVILVGASLAVIGNEIVAINTPKTAQVQKQTAEIVATFTIDGIKVEIATPEMRIENDEFIYAAPAGFYRAYGTCYRLSCKGDAPQGYVKGMDNETLHEVDPELQYCAPEGYILVGSKAIKVVDPIIEVDENGKQYFSLPEGYTLVGKIGLEVIDAAHVNKHGLH